MTPKNTIEKRIDLSIISELIPENVRVLDLGCGDGSLLHYLKVEKSVKGTGIEFSQEKIIECVKCGVPVIHGDLNDGLDKFTDKSFDYVVLSQTLQSVQRPDKLLLDMTRIGKKVIISVINLGFYKSRLQLMFLGKMPVTKSLPYKWYNTPNTHLSTIRDFQNLCKDIKINVIDRYPLNRRRNIISTTWPNMFSSMCIFLIESHK